MPQARARARGHGGDDPVSARTRLGVRDGAELPRQRRAGVPVVDVDRFFADLAAWADEREPGFETIAYGGHAEQVADVRRMGDHHVALVHGGFWRANFTRANTRAIAVDLALRGWTTWNVEYRRLGCGGGIPETLDDVAAAVVGAGADVVVGHSAGGHLALWAGTEAHVPAVALAAVCDLARAARDGLGGGAAVELAGGMPDERPDVYAAADPMRRLPPPAPQLVVHGDRDDRVPLAYSRRYAAAAGCELLELTAAGHFDVIDPRTAAWAAVAERIDALARVPG